MSDRRPRPTLEKVALRAGVSRATVSRGVNGNPNVSESIRSAVMRAVDELGYLPNPAARSLVTRRTDSVALIISEPSARIFSDDPFFAGVIRGVSLELEAAGRQLVLMMTEANADHGRIERYVAGGHVDGVMLVSLHGADPLPSSLARLGLPVVCGGRPLARVALPYTDCDNRGGAAAAVRHLLRLGRRRIATIAGPQDMNAGIDRLSGYRSALRETNCRSLVAVGDFTRESGERAMRQLLEDDPALDAVFVASDPMAIGALRALHRAGRRVPDDVAVVGFDDNDAARYSVPPLTTVRQPVEDLGRGMVRLLLRCFEGETAVEPVILRTELVVRESA
ncbi:MAG TPA: LacI family DNA-binding transcriptional regulator [Micromonosporaceae bacterium]